MKTHADNAYICYSYHSKHTRFPGSKPRRTRLEKMLDSMLLGAIIIAVTVIVYLLIN